MTWCDLMNLCWRISEKHRLLAPFEWLGDWMEDFGLAHGFITFNDDIWARINEYRTRTREHVTREIRVDEETRAGAYRLLKSKMLLLRGIEEAD